MSLTINTNAISMNAQRNTANSMLSLQTTMSRLSSGLRINSAKDDAAGLAIANRMNTQVRGMNVAIRNANDGMSMAQVAEGGLAQMTEMLQRMRELAVQAVNSTNTTGTGGDIDKLNQEYRQLSDELARMSASVQFNGQAILAGSADYQFQVGANSGHDNRITIGSGDISLSGVGSFSAVLSAGNFSALNITNNAANSGIIGALDNAIAAVDERRSRLGAVQSRFESTIAFLRTAVENQSAARGRILDADFAAETANLSRTQILQQAGTAMIAQANQLPQNVLALLR
jgi:flagellin